MNDIKLSGRLFLRKHDLQGQGIGTVTPGTELTFLVPRPGVKKFSKEPQGLSDPKSVDKMKEISKFD